MATLLTLLLVHTNPPVEWVPGMGYGGLVKSSKQVNQGRKSKAVFSLEPHREIPVINK